MFFIIFGWQSRSSRVGFVGPYTCGVCGWMGTFWLDRRERRFRLYFIPVIPWRAEKYFCTCRNCGGATVVDRGEGAELASNAAPLTAPDPFGPAQSAADDAPVMGQ